MPARKTDFKSPEASGTRKLLHAPEIKITKQKINNNVHFFSLYCDGKEKKRTKEKKATPTLGWNHLRWFSGCRLRELAAAQTHSATTIVCNNRTISFIHKTDLFGAIH